jgi:hypothetical protein
MRQELSHKIKGKLTTTLFLASDEKAKKNLAGPLNIIGDGRYLLAFLLAKGHARPQAPFQAKLSGLAFNLLKGHFFLTLRPL